MATTPPRSDPIHDQFYKPLHVLETWGDCAFYVSAALSLLVLFVTRESNPLAFEYLNVAFAVSVAVVFSLGVIGRLYLMRRADNARIHDFFEKAFDAPLTSTPTNGYYNNTATDPVRRVAAMTMENAFFSKNIALTMLRAERARVAVYLVIYIATLASRRPELGTVVALSQVVLSEQIVAKWIKLEWLRKSFEETYECTCQLFQSGPRTAAPFRAKALAAFTMYETAKANAGLTLSNKVFTDRNATLTTEWNVVRTKFNVS